jgi:hypothetical protein
MSRNNRVPSDEDFSREPTKPWTVLPARRGNCLTTDQAKAVAVGHRPARRARLPLPAGRVLATAETGAWEA